VISSTTGNMVVVQLALQGTHLGPLRLPAGTLPATGKRMDAPCSDSERTAVLGATATTLIPRLAARLGTQPDR
jgi:hypothetical protein